MTARDPLDRILDAGFNRAREALRVLEDLVRFARDDRPAQRALKRLRHRLSSFERPLGPRLLASRDAARDVGRDSDVRTEGGLAAVAGANFKRLQEALRSLEEASRGRVRPLHRGAAAMRFEAYELEREALPPLLRRARLEPVRFYVLLDPTVTSRPLDRVALEAVAGGAQMLQLRVKGASRADLRRLAGRVRKKIGPAVPILWNDRADPSADGVHLGADDISPAAARRRLGPEAIVGATTHSLAEARRALDADYLSCGPMFSTPLKPDLSPRGLSYWDEIRRLGRPVFAIGGITAANLPRLIERGVDRIAVCAGVIAQEDVKKAASRLSRLMARAGR